MSEKQKEDLIEDVDLETTVDELLDETKVDEEEIKVEEETAEDPEGQGEVDKSNDAAPKAKAPKTKAGMLNAMTKHMSGMKKEDLQAMYSKVVLGEDTDTDGEAKVDFSEDIDALVGSEESLSEDFRDKAAVIFEAAVSSKVKAEVEKLEESYEERLAEEVDSVKEDIIDKLDSCMDGLVESWFEKNEEAIRYNAKAELAESFLSGMKNLFTEHYVDVPEEKLDVVEELTQEVTGLEEQVATLSAANAELSESVETLAKADAFAELAEGLTEAKKEKFAELLEGVDFTSPEEYKSKATVIKESFFGDKPQKTATDTSDEVDNEVDETISESMARYVQAIKTLK